MIGGSKRNEAFDLPLAGNYFFGAPLPIGDKLLVIGELQGEISLYCLNASNGKPLWSTLLAYADIKIDSDVGRRWWAALPAVSEGVVICPTTVGWLVAVDLYTHEIVWMHRYLATMPQEREYQQLHYAMTDLQSLSERWASQPPLIIDGKVLMTAPEYDRLICLNLHDGSRVFSDMSRKNYTRLLGVVDDQIILSGANTLASMSMDVRRKVMKEFTFTPQIGDLSCVPVLTDDSICFTTTKNAFFTLPINSEWKTEDAISLPFRKAYQFIGNLFFHHGRMFQVGPFAFTAYEDFRQLQDQIAARLEQNSADPWAAMKQAQLAFSQGKASESVACLDVLDPKNLDAKLSMQYRDQMMTSLIELITSDFQGHDVEFARLGQFLESESDRHQYARLKIERHLARGENEQAFDDLIALSKSPLSEPIKPSPKVDVLITELQWIVARLHALAYSADSDTKAVIDHYITEHSQNHKDQVSLIRILSSHPLLEPVMLKVAERMFESDRENKSSSRPGTWMNAELLCLKLTDSADSKIRSQALLLYARELVRKGFHSQAASIYKRLTDDVLLEASFLNSPQAKALQDELDQHTSLPPINQLWAGKSFSMNRMGGHSYQSATGEILIQNPEDAPSQYFALQHLIGSSRLVVTLSDGSSYASIPLTSRGDNFVQNSDIPAWHLGESLILAYGGYLHCVSLAEKSLVWSHPVRVRSSAYELEFERDSNTYMMRQIRGFPTLLDLLGPKAIPGMVAYVSPEMICYYGTRSIVAINPSNGELLWEHDKISLSPMLVGTSSMLYLFSDDPDESRLLQPTDGTIVSHPELSEMLFQNLASKLLAVVDGRFITLSSSGAALLGIHRPSVLSCWEPTINFESGRYSLESVWEQEIEYKDYIGRLDSNSLLLFSGVPDSSARNNSERELFRLDLSTGTLLDLGVIPSNDLIGVKQIYLVPDADQAYLFVSKSNSYNSYQHSYYDLDGLTFSGKVYGLDLQKRSVSWSQNVRNQTVILDHYRSNPLLVMIYRRGLNKEDIYINELRIQALSKADGKLVLDYKTTTYENFQSVNIDLRAQAIELATYDTRYRIQLDEKATPPPAPSTTPEEPEEDADLE